MADSTDSQATADLVTAARAGDHAAFAGLIQRHYPMVYALCTRALGDEDLARDAAQEAAVTAMLGLARLRHDDRFGAWLAGIALNLCRRLLRDRDWAAFSLDALLEDQLISEPAGTGPDPAEAAAAAEVTRRIKDAVSALPPGQRQAAEAYYLTGLTQAETAARLRIPASAVKTRLHKARTALRASLHDYQPERHAAMNTEMVPVTISGVVKTTGSDSSTARRVPYYIGLTETGGDRQMWIGVGRAEAAALALSLSGNELPRPMTYQFTAALLTAAGATVQEIRVTRLTDGIFYAQVLLSGGAVIDARPSDALNLAAISNAPVYAAAELLDLATRNASHDSPRKRPTITAVRYDPAPQPEQE
jgi:RNA polymerase sigma factor (sigma-70 family)